MSVVTRVVAAQEGPEETMRRALPASSAKEASAASAADVVDKNQMGGEKLVLLIGSPMCQTFRGLVTTMMRDANRVIEVKYKNFVEQCVGNLSGNVGVLLLHENLWKCGLVDSASPRRWRRVLARAKRRVHCVFLVGRCKTWCIDTRSVGNLDALDVDVISSRLSKGASESSGRNRGLRVRVLVLREASEHSMSQETEEPRHGTVEGFEEKQRKEQERVQVLSRVRQVWSGCEIQRCGRVRSKHEKLGGSEMRRHGERRSERALEIGAVLLLREKSQDLGWNRFVCCSDCVRSSSLVRNEKLQAMYGSECSKGERQVPRCAILVRGSENGRDVRSLGDSLRERHESRCGFPLVTTKIPKRVRTTRDVERNWNWNQTQFSNCQF